MSSSNKDIHAAQGIIAITPSDTTVLNPGIRALSVLVSGNVVVECADGTTGTIYIAAGSPFSIAVRKVTVTGTTATGITGLL